MHQVLVMASLKDSISRLPVFKEITAPKHIGRGGYCQFLSLHHDGQHDIQDRLVYQREYRGFR